MNVYLYSIYIYIYDHIMRMIVYSINCSDFNNTKDDLSRRNTRLIRMIHTNNDKFTQNPDTI